ncbi:MBOAT family O-acyltransferase [Prevotella sp.]|uniref:MBOAT family O-acyltransferase n=1 Tax=Prevotella sp. TaxID=59823 RepID=UPI0039C1DF8C
MIDNIAKALTYDPTQPMIFSSGIFLWLFLGFAFIYMLLQNKLTARLVFVTLFSYFFYYKSSGIYFFLLAVVTVSDWLIGRMIGRVTEREPDNRLKARMLVALSVTIDLALLAYFKYTNFFLGSLSQIIGNNFQPLDIFLPVGISFFTFQSLSYTIDIYRREIRPLESLLDYAFFVSFFPQLVAGPIVKARDFVPQIRKPLSITRRMFGMGVYLITIGLFKKAVISDYISINFVERVFDQPEMFSGVEVLLGIYGYAMQIYCDFSGYSDMAIGIALLLGFRFPMNFNAPYRSVSVTDFWRRWHISLSTWLKQYLYISLGGNRKGKLRTYANLTTTMLLGGLWHGASWNFILWGALHGVALSVHKFFSQNVFRHDKRYTSTGWRQVGAIILTFHFVCFCWIFFRSSDFDTGITMITQVTTNFHPELLWQVVSGYPWVFGLMAFGFVSHFLPDRWQQRIVARLSMTNVLVYAAMITAVAYIVIQVKSSEIQPFIYFQF